MSEEGEDISSDFSIPAEYSSTPNSPDWYVIFIDGFSSDYTMSTFKNAVDEFICFSESEAKSGDREIWLCCYGDAELCSYITVNPV